MVSIPVPRIAFFGLVTLSLGGLAGCQTAAPVGAPAPAATTTATVAEATATFRSDLQDARQRAWQTALDIARVYRQVPAAQCPGLAGLARDLEDTRLRITGPWGAQLDQLDSAVLITRNPNFWRASMELSPSDGSLLLLQAVVHAAAGEIWMANRVLMATTQLLPIDARTRPLYLAHTYGMGAIILDSIEGIDERTNRAAPAEVDRVYREALATWPGNALVLTAMIELRARRAVQESPSRRTTGARLDDAVRAAALGLAAAEIDRLHRIDPISAAPYRGDAGAREAGQRLLAQWQRLSDRAVVLGHKEVAELVSDLERAEAPELALVLQRLLVVARGFASPGDAVTWRRILPQVLPPAEAQALLDDWAEGRIVTIALSGLAPGEDEWTGDPATNPLLRQQLDRELGERDFRVEMLRQQPTALATALRERGEVHHRAGRLEAALADFAEAEVAGGGNPWLGIARAGVLADLQRDAEATAELARARQHEGARAEADFDLAVLHFARGRYAEARVLFRAEARRVPAVGWPSILADLSARRDGESERRLLVHSRELAPPGSWLARCLSFALGQLTEEELLRRAREGADMTIAGQLSEAHFLIAQVRLAQGDTVNGIRHLEGCVGAGMSNMIEYRLARQELRRLVPEPAAPADAKPAEPAKPRDPAETPAGSSWGASPV